MASCDAMLMFLHEAFVAFNEVLASESSCWETSKVKLQQLKEQWHHKGLSGANALNFITQYQSQINWQDMPPDQFGRFYRFVFHLCRDPGKRNVQMDLAVPAWRLILAGRFRLLERWCNFAAASNSLVVTQDLWRQVLDFSRTVHEDLSNFDAAGSWAVLLDEFVEDLRNSRRRPYATPEGGGRSALGCTGGSSSNLLARQASSGPDLATLFAASSAVGAAGDGGDGGAGMGVTAFLHSLSPRCGSKRRGPDVDVVAEQLSAMPLGAGQHPQGAGGGAAGGSGQGPMGLPPVRACSQSSGHAGPGGLPYGGAAGFPDTLAKRQCVERQLQPQQHSQPLQPQHSQQLQSQQDFPHGRMGPMGVGAESMPGPAPGIACGAMGAVGGGGMLGRAPSSGQPMSCSTGSLDSDGSQGAPAGSAAMDCWLQDPLSRATQEQLQLLHLQQQQQQQQQLCAPQHCQQRRAIKARRSGLSDIVKSAVSDALGF